MKSRIFMVSKVTLQLGKRLQKLSSFVELSLKAFTSIMVLNVTGSIHPIVQVERQINVVRTILKCNQEYSLQCSGRLFVTLVYRTARMKNQIQTQKYRSIKIAFPKYKCMMPISYPKPLVPYFVFKTWIPSINTCSKCSIQAQKGF